MSKNIAVIVAAGSGVRFKSGEVPKQYHKLCGIEIINHTIKKFIDCKYIDLIFTIINQEHIKIYESVILKNDKLLSPIIGGKTRQETVMLALEYIKKYNPQNILIHDAVRCMLTTNLINKICKELKTQKAVFPAVPVEDTIKKINPKTANIKTINRENLYHAQTPQAFDFETILKAHSKFKNEIVTDDISLLEKLAINVKLIEGEKNNFKITTREDFKLAEAILQNTKKYSDIRVGFGYDVHAFEDGKGIKLCGITIPYSRKLKGHSDADVAMHALCDAIFGAIGEKDIGQHFPPNDDRWKNTDSDEFLKYCLGILKEKNATLNNIDITIICEEPKISPFIDDMRKNIAKITKIEINRVAVKATTTERLGFTGKKQGIAANAIATIMII